MGVRPFANRKQNGFTIVELLIVIVVIGILTAIVIVAFNGVQTRAQNAQKATEMKAWQKAFETYRAQYGTYSDMPNGGAYCLGKGFSTGGGGVARCRDFQGTSATSYLESDNAALMTELAKVITIPQASNIPVGGTLGPYAIYDATSVTITGWFKDGSGECPQGMIFQWNDAATGRVACVIRLMK